MKGDVDGGKKTAVSPSSGDDGKSRGHQASHTQDKVPVDQVASLISPSDKVASRATKPTAGSLTLLAHKGDCAIFFLSFLKS
nr:unnamed protein product [Digitaria exilis]